MTTKTKAPGKILQITAGGAVTSGSVQEVGSQLIGVALKAASASGDLYPLATEGVFTIGKKTSETWAVGDELYWDAGASTASKTYVAGAADKLIGVATAVAASAATTGDCKLRGGAEAQGQHATTTEAETDALIGLATLGADRLAADQMTAAPVAVVADNNAQCGIPVIHVIDVPAAAGDTDVTVTEAFEVLMIQCLKTDEAGVASGTLTVKNGSDAITDAITWDNTVADKTVAAPGTIDDAFSTFAAAGTLRVTTSQAQARGLVTIIGRKV